MYNYVMNIQYFHIQKTRMQCVFFQINLKSKCCFKKIENSEIKELVLTDSIQATEKIKNSEKIRHISIAPLIGEAIKRINSDSSVSALFD